MENKENKITKTIEIDQDKYEQFLTENASLKKEIEMLKSKSVDHDVITVSSIQKPTDDKKVEKKKGILI